MSVTTTREAASTLQEHSPLHYDLLTGGTLGSVTSFLSSWPSEGIASKPQIYAGSSDGEARDEVSGDMRRKGFIVHIFPSETYPHIEMINRSPLYGSWPKVPGYETFMSSTLRESVPKGIASDGLSDWETGGQFGHEDTSWVQETLLKRNKAEERRQFFKERTARRQQWEKMPTAMKGLAQAGTPGSTRKGPVDGDSVP
jgi:hypothetical protein